MLVSSAEVTVDLVATAAGFLVEIAALVALALWLGRSWAPPDTPTPPEPPAGPSSAANPDPRSRTPPIGAPMPPAPALSTLRSRVAPRRPTSGPRAVTVPAVTAVFWVIKVLTTGMGEAAADWLAKVSVVLAAGLGALGLVAALGWQLRAGEYRAVRYWSAVAMVAVFGTMVADGPHVVLGLSYPVMTTLSALGLAAVFGLWYRSEGTLSVHSITAGRREIFYWAAVLATFALGTALGDLTAVVWHLGFAWSALLFAVLITLPALGRARFGLHPVLAFWSAYVLTRPLGASVADWLGKPPHLAGGLGLGDGPVAGVALVLIVGLVAWCAVTRRDVQPAAPAEDPQRAQQRVQPQDRLS